MISCASQTFDARGLAFGLASNCCFAARSIYVSMLQDRLPTPPDISMYLPVFLFGRLTEDRLPTPPTISLYLPSELPSRSLVLPCAPFCAPFSPPPSHSPLCVSNLGVEKRRSGRVTEVGCHTEDWVSNLNLPAQTARDPRVRVRNRPPLNMVPQTVPVGGRSGVPQQCAAAKVKCGGMADHRSMGRAAGSCGPVAHHAHRFA